LASVQAMSIHVLMGAPFHFKPGNKRHRMRE
jgi:hypothetical protein